MRRNALAAPVAPTRPARPRLDPDYAARTRPALIEDPALHPILLAPRALLTGLFSFETLLVLYMFAGIYKEDPRFAWLPVDATALFFALSVVVGSFIIVVNPIHRRGLPVVFAMLCLVVWLLVTLSWSPSRIYGPSKVFLMATLELWAVIAGALIIAPNPERLRRLFTLLLLFALWIGVEVVLIYGAAGGQAGRIFLGSASYLMVGRLCGLGALVALAAWLYARNRAVGWLCLALFVVLGFVLAIGGGRGPLLATVLALLIPIGLSIRLTTRRIRYSPTLLSVLVLLLATAVGLVLYGVVTEHRLETLRRLEQLSTPAFGSAGDRVELYGGGARLAARAPLLGSGAGSWPLLTGHRDRVQYPHNLFVELLVESGLIGVALFVTVLAVALRSASLDRLRQDPQALCTMMLFANTFFNALVSADLPGNRAMFMMLGALALFAIRPFAGAVQVAAPVRVGDAAPLDLSETPRRPGASDQARPVETKG
jgi:O-antigen ligase